MYSMSDISHLMWVILPIMLIQIQGQILVKRGEMMQPVSKTNLFNQEDWHAFKINDTLIEKWLIDKASSLTFSYRFCHFPHIKIRVKELWDEQKHWKYCFSFDGF